jgi:protein-tyrosine phosphatase
MKTLTQSFFVDGPWSGRLAVSARPRGGDWLDEEMGAWRMAGVDTVASLLTADEAAEMELGEEETASLRNGMEFAPFPIPDRTAPSGPAVHSFVDGLFVRLRRGESVVVHCRQGVGRAGLIAVALLIEAGLGPEEAIERVSKARGVSVPETAEQRVWIESLGESLTQQP